MPALPEPGELEPWEKMKCPADYEEVDRDEDTVMRSYVPARFVTDLVKFYRAKLFEGKQEWDLQAKIKRKTYEIKEIVVKVKLKCEKCVNGVLETIDEKAEFHDEDVHGPAVLVNVVRNWFTVVRVKGVPPPPGMDVTM
jgi:hypothetical protein